MNNERLSRVLLGPVVSEKSSRVADKSQQIVFKVLPGASKLEIRNAVEKMFDVKVTAVQVANVKGKVKRFGQTLGRRSDWKKAYVTLAEGSDINFMGAVYFIEQLLPIIKKQGLPPLKQNIIARFGRNQRMFAFLKE